MKTEKAIAVLNDLIQINNDRIEGYRTAFEETEEAELKAIFSDLKSTSIKNNAELRAEVSRLGGTPTDETKITGKFFRVWMDVKAAITGKNRKLILDSCEFGEDVAKKTYADALKDHAEDLNDGQQSMVRAQHRTLIEDHDRVKNLREVEA